MHVQDYLQLVLNSESQMATAFSEVSEHHKDEPDVFFMCQNLSSWSEKHVKQLEPLRMKYEKHAGKTNEPKKLKKNLFKGPRKGPMALLRDLHDLWLITKEIEISYKVLLQAAKALRDTEMETLLLTLSGETKRQSDWLLTRIKQAAPQILVVAD